MYGFKLCLVALFVAELAYANSAVTIRSSISAQDSFEVVYSSSKSDTNQAPGIYAFTRKKDSGVMVVKGNVLDVSRGFNGILGQFGITRTTHAHESMAVVDGRLVIFNQRSTPDDPKSTIVFGENTPLIDAITGTKTALSPILSTETKAINVQIFDEYEHQGDLFLVSIKQPNIHGNGITFAGILDRNSKTPRLLGEPLVIDYTFQSAANLRKLSKGRFSVLSRNHLLSNAQPAASDDRILRKYREKLAQLANELRGRAVEDSATKKASKSILTAVDPETGMPFSPPTFNILSKQLVADQLPVQQISDTPFLVQMRVDPFRGRSGIFLGIEGSTGLHNGDLPAHIAGTIDYDLASHRYKILDPTSTGIKGPVRVPQSEALEFISINGRSHILFADNFGQLRVVDVERMFSVPHWMGAKQVAAIKSKINIGNHLHHVFFISFDLGKTSATWAVKVSESEGQLFVQDKIKLSSKFSDVPDLRKRIREIPLNGEHQLLFDNINERFPKEETPETLATTRSIPYVDLKASSSAQIAQLYEKPTRIERIHGDVLEWRYFNPKGAIRSKSGFYLKTPHALRELSVDTPEYQFLQGTLLSSEQAQSAAGKKKPKTKKNKNDGSLPEKFSPIIMEQKIEVADPDMNGLRMIMVPYQTNEQMAGAAVGFQLAILTIEKGTGTSVFSPLLTSIYIPFSFDRFQGIKLIQGRRKAVNEISMLIFAGEKEGAMASHPAYGGAGVMIVPMRMSMRYESPLNRIALTTPHGVNWMHSGELSPLALKNRVTFDAEGNALWIATPEIEQTNRFYKLEYLNREEAVKAVYPNKGLNTVSIRYDEVLDEDFELAFRKDSRWYVDFGSQLEVRFPAFAKYMEEVRKRKSDELSNAKKKRNPAKPAEILFPDLNDYLNQLSTLESANDHRVLLVDPDLYHTVRNQIMQRLVTYEDDNGFRLNNDAFRFYAYDPNFTPEETTQNLQLIGRNPSKKDLLYLDIETVLATEVSNPSQSYIKSESKAEDVADGETSETDETPADDGATEQENEKQETETAAAEEDKDEESDKTDLSGKHEADTHDRLSRFQEPSNREEEIDKTLTFKYSRLAHIVSGGDPVDLRRFSQPLPKRFSSLSLATPAQWRALMESHPKELAAGVFDQFKMDARFLTASWTVWSPKSSRVSKEVADYNRNPFSRDEYQVFQNLERLLMSMSQPDGSTKHQLLVVPPEIKPLITKLIMTRWATDSKDLTGTWNYKNRNLALFQVNSPSTTQENIIDNYESMRGSLVSRRPVLLADMSDLLKIGRPDSPDRAFRLRDPVSGVGKTSEVLNTLLPDGNDNPTDTNGDEVATRSQLPHVLWWIASEGKKIQPKKARGWQLSQEVKPQIPTLIVTTEKEIEDLRQDTAFEGRFLDLEEMFQFVQLDKPTDEEKKRLVEDLFRRPDIASLQYAFIHENLTSEEARRQLIGLLIGKVEQISSQLGIESTHAFLKIYVTLKRALTDDTELRRQREIDSSYLFRLFSKVFPLPLSYSILRKDDPWQKLRDPDRAARSLQELGYEGSLEFKSRFVRDITSHTRGGMEAGRKVPSSLVVIGEPGTGKTLIFEKVIELLGLKLYDYNKPGDEDVGAMIIRVQDIVDEDDPAHPEKISIAKLIKHINNFLSMPNGWRGMVLFDDLHKAASTKILKELMTYIQTLFEAQNGLIKVRRLTQDGQVANEAREIPVRNLQLGITLNPTKDKKKRERFLDRWENNNPVLEAVAALTRDDYQLEDSVFSRVSDVIDMSEFPREAKIPSLLNKMREANHQEFSAHPRVVAVTPRTLDVLVSAFPHSNARDFLTPATYSLLNLPSGLGKAPIYIIDPADKLPQGQEDPLGEGAQGEGWGIKVEPGQIEESLRRSTVVHAVHVDDPRSKLHLLSFLLENFRGMVYNSVVLGTQASPEMSANHESRITLMTSFLAAMVGNLKGYPQLPISNVNIKPQELGVKTYDGIGELQAAIAKHSKNVRRQSLSIPTYQNTEERVDLNSFLGIEAPNPPERQRMDVLIETSQRIQKILEPLLASTLQTSSLSALNDPSVWINQLSDKSPKEAFKAASQEILSVYLDFSRQLYDLGLLEMRSPENLAQMQIYDEVRLFTLCLDNALTQMPWSFVTDFLLRSLNLATTDLAVGQKTGLQHFLFKSQYSLLATITPESIIANANSIGVMKSVTPERSAKWEAYFDGNCENFMVNSQKEVEQ